MYKLPHPVSTYLKVPTDTLSYGKNADEVLTVEEEQFLDSAIVKDNTSFSFVGKTVIFFTGSGGRLLSDKTLFFDRLKYRTPCYIHIFNKEQKNLTGKYDVAIIFGSKRLESTDRIARLIKRKLKSSTSPRYCKSKVCWINSCILSVTKELISS